MSSDRIKQKQGKIVAKLLPTEARLRDGRPKFRNGVKKVFKAKRKKFVTTRKEMKGKERKGKEEELQRSFANCLRRLAVKNLVSAGVMCANFKQYPLCKKKHVLYGRV